MKWSIPNILTLLRIPLIFLILAISEIQPPYTYTLIMGLLVISMVTDFLDGYLARKWNQVSNLGKILDPLLDKLFVLGLFMWMLSTGLLESWNLFILLALLLRELAVTGLRGGSSGSGKSSFGADWFGKWKTTLLFVSLFFVVVKAMLERDFQNSGPVSEVMGYIGILCLWVGSLLGIYSGIRYFRQHL